MSSGGDGLLGDITAQYRNGTVVIHDYERMRSFLRDQDYTPVPGDQVIWKSTGNVFFRQKKYDRAVQCYTNAVEIDQCYTDALNNLGMTYKMLGQEENAARVFGDVAGIEGGGDEMNKKNPGYFLSPSVRERPPLRYRIIDSHIGIPVWCYGLAAALIVYGVVVNRVVGGILWALLVLATGYIIMRIRLKHKKIFEVRFLLPGPATRDAREEKNP